MREIDQAGVSVAHRRNRRDGGSLRRPGAPAGPAAVLGEGPCLHAIAAEPVVIVEQPWREIQWPRFLSGRSWSTELRHETDPSEVAPRIVAVAQQVEDGPRHLRVRDASAASGVAQPLLGLRRFHVRAAEESAEGLVD
jgi:hypothetical protein